MATMINVSGVDLEVEERGSGQPLLFLHAGEGLEPQRPWLDLLAKKYRVIAPSHPGFGRSSLPDWMGETSDLAYLYLDLTAKLGLKDAVLAGASFGGWIAAEMAVRNTSAFQRLVLAAPLGIKVRGREERDIADFHSMTDEEFIAAAWADPAKGKRDLTQLPDTELAAIVRGREALALFGWRPYMHNPRLKRWLHRIDKPVHLIWGDKDRIVTPAYAEGWRAEIAGRKVEETVIFGRPTRVALESGQVEAKLDIIPGCGHFPHWEKPEEFARLVG